MMEIEQPIFLPEKVVKSKSCVLDELDDNLQGGISCNGNSLDSGIGSLNGNGHGHIGRSLSGCESIPEEEEDDLGLEEFANKEAEIGGAGHHRKGHRSGSLASTGSNKSGGNASVGLNARGEGGAALRLIRKAKRTSRDRAYSTSEEGPFGSTPAALLSGPPGRSGQINKNSRKSRNGIGRGLPKKGGAGGKGTWGKLGCELELPWVDPNDPNYESDGDDNIVNDVPVHVPIPKMVDSLTDQTSMVKVTDMEQR